MPSMVWYGTGALYDVSIRATNEIFAPSFFAGAPKGSNTIVGAKPDWSFGLESRFLMTEHNLT